MDKKLTEEEVWVRKELTKLYPQLVINCQKTLGAGYEKHGGDLRAVCIEFFLNKPIEVQVKSFKEGKAENFITFMMGMQSKSGTSKYYHQYRKFNESQRELYDNYDYGYLKTISDSYTPFEDEDDDMMLCIKHHMKNLNPYEKMLIDARVIRGMRFKDISDTYDIPYSSLSRELIRILKKLKKECQHFQ